MLERWDHRADLAEQAIAERHAARVWGLPGTNLGIIGWPATPRDRYFIRWHYWWQAHYLDCQIDAASRRPTQQRLGTLRRTFRGMRIRNLRGLTHNHYYDDKAWLALALGRTNFATRTRRDLEANIFAGVDSLTGVLPWRTGETFYNTPTNGPAAIIAARTGRLELASYILDWTFDNLINEHGLVRDGLRMSMHGPTPEPAIYTYCQGVILGACVEYARAAGPTSDAGRNAINRAIGLIAAIDRELTDSTGVILDPNADSAGPAGGDGGLFNGILVRYLTLAAQHLPEIGTSATAARHKARRIVLASANSAWRYRLEVDGLPVFPVHWQHDATLPQAGAPGSQVVPERDLSVQLSGWMLMEAAARVTD